MSEESSSSSSSSSSLSGDERIPSALPPSSSSSPPPPPPSESAVNETKSSCEVKSEGGSKAKNNNDASSSSNNNNKKKKRKRGNKKKRSKSEDERELLAFQMERYDRLIFNARKQLRKTAKQVRTFLLQKEIRKRGGGGASAGGESIDAKKALNLDVVTSQAIRQLGLYHCDPRFRLVTTDTATEEANTNPNEGGTDEVGGETEAGETTTTIAGEQQTVSDSGTNDKNHNGSKSKRTKTNKTGHLDDSTQPVIPDPLAPDDPQKPLVDAVLAHNRFSKSLGEWNAKVTDYRRWCMKLEQRNNPNPFDDFDDYGSASKRGKKGKSKSKKGGGGGAFAAGLQATVENESSLFCTLGEPTNDGGAGMDESNKYSQYGPGGADMGDGLPKRKNRKGQRQRRAKALALEAKKRGRSHEYYQSSNWREAKEWKPENEGGADNSRNKKGHHRSKQIEQQQQNEPPKKKSDVEEKQHPSWAAKQAQSTGIVAFKGTKITF